MDLTVAKTKTKIKNTGMTYVSIFNPPSRFSKNI